MEYLFLFFYVNVVFCPSLIRMAASEAVSKANYIVINLQITKFIVAMCALSFSCH